MHFRVLSRGVGGSERRPFCVTFQDFEACMLRNSVVLGPDLKRFRGNHRIWEALFRDFEGKICSDLFKT